MAITKVYWRSNSIPPGAHVLLIVASLAALVVAETFRRKENRADYANMLAASENIQRGLDLIRERRRRLEPLDPELDPLGTGLIGLTTSEVTTVSGHLESKQASVNPNWGAVLVDLLREAGVERDDCVAVAVSGSFPALNLAVYCALEQLGAQPLIIASASASQFGANLPELLWLDMEALLHQEGVIAHRAVAASLGGVEDRGVGISDQGQVLLRAAIERSGAELLDPVSYEEAVLKRIATYVEHAGDREIAAFVNVGGGTATTGPAATDKYFGAGLITSAPAKAFAVESVIGHFLQQEVPVINMSSISTLAREAGLPYPPLREPILGSGGVYEETTYRRLLALALAVSLLAVVFLVTRVTAVRTMFRRTSHGHAGIEPTM